MESISIRDAIDADIPALRMVLRAAAWSIEGDRELLTTHPEYLELTMDAAGVRRTRVAEIGGVVVGFVSTDADSDTTWDILDLFVDPSAMRRGVGRSLVLDALDRARTNGVVRLDVDANDHAVHFYERVGFVATAPTRLPDTTAARVSAAGRRC